MICRTTILWIGLAIHLLGIASFGQGRLFMIPAGESPASFPSGTTVVNVDGVNVQAGGFTLTLEVFLESTSPSSVRGYQIVLDDATGGTGTVDYNPAGAVLPTIDTGRGEYLFTSAVSALATVVDLGAPARLADAVEDASGDSVAVTNAVYLGEITYEFSTDAKGTFSIAFLAPGTDPLTSQTIAVDDSNTPIALTADGVTINITGGTIPAVQTWGLLSLALLLLVAGAIILRKSRRVATAMSLVGVGVLLLAGSPITLAGSGGCREFGDVDDSGGVGLTDLDCVRDGFRGVFINCTLEEVDLAPCAGNGEINLFDLLRVMDAFPSQGVPACGEVCAFEPPSWEVPSAALGESPRAGDANPMRNVYGFSGEYNEYAVDLAIKGRGFMFVWARRYRSKVGPDTAQGNCWDFSYNIRLEAVGPNLILHDGNGRGDTYERQPDGTWTRRGYFRQIIQNPDDSYTVVFPHFQTWNIAKFDASPVSGKIRSIVDRNGNTMSFEYDESGRLTLIGDTLDNALNPRKISIAYDANGFISTVTDFTGRQIKYLYYNLGEAGGNAGDLKSVTSPVVVGTPTGNDFPTGKTTTYTYSTGFADNRLNHNLLTITDPKGQTFLINEYATTLIPSDLEFDHLVRQTWGNSGEVLDVTYGPDPGGLAVKAVFNDRVGNVSECDYDISHRLRRRHKFTGRATPNVPTTLSANRPTGQVRASDPVVYTTQFEYNADALLTRVVFPNLNEHLYVYDTANPAKRSQGNTLLWQQLPGPLGADQVQIDHTFAYDLQFNYVTQHTDGRSNIWRYAYDVSGNLTQRTYPDLFVEDLEHNAFGQVTRHVLPSNGTSRRDDSFTYYVQADRTQNGYLKASTVDALGLALTTTFQYDLVGNVTRIIDPKSQDLLVTYNTLDQVVQAESRTVSLPAGPVRYQNQFYYDGNNNIVRLGILDVDDQGLTDPADEYITTIYEHDILNYVTRICQESGSHPVPLSPPQLDCTGLPDSEFISNVYTYDANRNLTLALSGEAAEGREPANTITTTYDERDLVFQSVRAATDAAHATFQYDYDLNGNLQATREGLESAPRVSTFTYDGFNRRIIYGGAMGNTTTYSYDSNDNLTLMRVDGELDDQPGNASNIRLAETRFEYDPENRLTLIGDSFFNRDTQAPLASDGESTMGYSYNDNFQLTSVTDDNGNVTRTAYDSANRVSLVTDALNNTVTFTYDPNSNVITKTDVDRSDLGSPDQTFVTSYTYDARDRMTRRTDSSNNATDLRYDSRDNIRRVRDPLSVETLNVYDAINRRTLSIRDMNGTGADPADPADIVIGGTWDDNSRPVTRFDDNGNTTSYLYDALNRMTRQTYADTTTDIYVYDVHDNLTTRTDQNGSVITGTFDLLNRRTGNTILPGPGVSSDTTFESYRYDGLGSMVRAEDNDSVVNYRYDSIGNLTSEVLTISPSGLSSTSGTTTNVYDGVGNLTICGYPSGRQITTTYDPLNRKKTVSDTTSAPAQVVATYNYIGASRVERRDYGNNTRCEYDYDGIQGVANPQGDSGVRRIIGSEHVNLAIGVSFDKRQYRWDPLYNKRSREDITPGAPTPLLHKYDYDPMYRLTRTTVTEALSPPPPPLRVTDYTLDGVGNRQSVFSDNCTGQYTMDPMVPPADFQMNQYSVTGCDDRTYDENGNLSIIANSALGPVKTMAFNYRNELTEFQDLLAAATTTYTYDATGRRIAKNVTGGGAIKHIRFYYDGINCIEEQDGGGATQATYVYGLYIDEVLNMQRSSTGVLPVIEDFYYHTDDLYNVMAVTDATGTVVERYEYADYGQPIDRITLAPVVGDPSAIGNPYLFSGRRYDNESGLYYYRARYLDPVAGRFIQTDPIGNWSDAANLGNASAYCGNNPWTMTDPSGRAIKYYPQTIYYFPVGGGGNTVLLNDYGRIRFAHGGGGGGGSTRVRYPVHFHLSGYKVGSVSGGGGPWRGIVHEDIGIFGGGGGGGGGPTSGVRVHSPFRIVKVIDKATPGFHKALCSGAPASGGGGGHGGVGGSTRVRYPVHFHLSGYKVGSVSGGGGPWRGIVHEDIGIFGGGGGGGGGPTSGVRVHSPFRIVKVIDKATPGFHKALCSGARASGGGGGGHAGVGGIANLRFTWYSGLYRYSGGGGGHGGRGGIANLKFTWYAGDVGIYTDEYGRIRVGPSNLRFTWYTGGEVGGPPSEFKDDFKVVDESARDDGLD